MAVPGTVVRGMAVPGIAVRGMAVQGMVVHLEEDQALVDRASEADIMEDPDNMEALEVQVQDGGKGVSISPDLRNFNIHDARMLIAIPPIMTRTYTFTYHTMSFSSKT